MMRADMTFTGEKGDTPIVAKVGDGEFGLISFRQGVDSFVLVLPPHMKPCLETIARVFNECMDVEPVKPTENITPAPAHRPERGQYIGLTRDRDSEVPIGGLNHLGDVRMDDDGSARIFAVGGVLIVTAEVAMQATKFGWELAPEHPTSGDLVAIKR